MKMPSSQQERDALAKLILADIQNNLTCSQILEKHKITDHVYSTIKKNYQLPRINLSGRHNPMFGKTFYQKWVEKYGKEIADQKLVEYKKKISKQTSGKGNPMFGRPSPQRSGSGWKGWYKNHFFRSLRELSFMVELDNNNKTWISGEKRKYKIEYYWNNVPQNYFPDFVVGDTIFEVKPKKLWTTPRILAKKHAAIDFCAKNNLKYELVDPKIDFFTIKSLYEQKIIIFMPKYELKFKNYQNGISSSL